MTHLKLLVHSYKFLFLEILEPMIDFSEASSKGKRIGLPKIFSNEKEERKVWLLTRDNMKVFISHMDN